jgi:two-component system, NtrC family, sensor kinase
MSLRSPKSQLPRPQRLADRSHRPVSVDLCPEHRGKTYRSRPVRDCGATLQLIEYQLRTRDNITIVKELSQSLPPMICHAGGISQVLINLLSNAADAMSSGGGQITIRTSYDPAEELFFLQVSDSGGGVLADALENIFYLFFTTKEVGKGPGLGLSVSMGIAQSHGGEIKVHSVVGQGATFTVALPKSPPPAGSSGGVLGRY